MTEADDIRGSPREQARMRDLLALVPAHGDSVLDVGARDGYLAKNLVGRFKRVVALDLSRPDVADARVECVEGDASALAYADNTFDTVVCAEVLEHIPAADLARTCGELSRVARRAVVIGVPYQQDLRFGETLCLACRRVNPPWGHLNVFDEQRVATLFAQLELVRHSYVGRGRNRTNALAARLMRFAGNPYGTYVQDEPCVHCGAPLQGPAPRTALQKVVTKLAFHVERLQQTLTSERAIWIHTRFDKRARHDARAAS